MESSDMEDSPMRRNIIARKKPSASLDYASRHLEQLKGRAYAVTGEVASFLPYKNFMQEEDICLEITRARLSSVLKRHEELKERLSSYVGFKLSKVQGNPFLDLGVIIRLSNCVCH